MPFIHHTINPGGDGYEQPDDMPIYNVLLIGQSQSGKSTLLEAIKQYADPNYKYDSTRIGNGNVSLTTEVRIEEVVTCLPSYRIYETNRFGRQEIDVERYMEETTFDDFKALLNRQDVEVMAEGGATFSRFRIIDTPGLDDSEGRDIENLGKIFSAIQGLGNLHLVVITDRHGTTLSPGYQTALKTYSRLFSTMHGLMTFVMTSIPYKQRHPGRKKNLGLDTKLKERVDIISEIMGRRFPSFKIDCNLVEFRPFHICLVRNTLRDLLSTATIKTPVGLKLQIYKTPAMKAVDEDVYTTYSEFFTNLELNRDTLDLADRLRLDIIQTESVIANKEDELWTIDTEELLHLYEVRFSQDWEHFYIIKPTLLQYSTFDCSIASGNLSYPAVEILTDLGDDLVQVGGDTVEKIEEKGGEVDGSVIDKVMTTHSSVDILEVYGGEGHKYWKVLFRRKSYTKGHFHAILSIKSCNKHRTRIDILKQDILQLGEKLGTLKQERNRRLIELELQGVPITTAVDPKAYQSLHDRLSIYRKMMEATEGWHLRLEVFLELAKSGVYHGGSAKASAHALEQFWAKKLGFDPKNHSTYKGQSDH